MTAEPTKPDSVDGITPEQVALYEDMFMLGYAKSDRIVIFDDGEKNKLTVQFRTLLPYEIRDIAEVSERYSSPAGKFIVEQIETLARSIVLVNDTPLVLDTASKTAVFGSKPVDSLDQAKYILTQKLRSTPILDALFDAYQDFAGSIDEKMNDLKKKSKTTF